LLATALDTATLAIFPVIPLQVNLTALSELRIMSGGQRHEASRQTEDFSR
jgi:hypothetical protein